MNRRLLKMAKEEEEYTETGIEFRKRMHRVKTKQDKHNATKHAKKLAYRERQL